jgi:peroxiredoxin Q/BCP
MPAWLMLTLAAAGLAVGIACARRGGELLVVGAPAPDFTATTHTGERVTLAAQRGRWVVLYFYPKDDTPGCTKEACAFRDAASSLRDANVVVLGVSEDSAASHARFAEKYELAFPLLPDERGTIAAAYHVPVTLGFARRITYLIDKEGRVARVWPSVTPAAHASEILAAVRERERAR